jgi:hypothetical protein
MGFYSFIVRSPGEVPLPDYMIYLDHGQNVFNALVEDLDGFKKLLASEGVSVLQVNRLDEYEQVEPVDSQASLDELFAQLPQPK